MNLINQRVKLTAGSYAGCIGYVEREIEKSGAYLINIEDELQSRTAAFSTEFFIAEATIMADLDGVLSDPENEADSIEEMIEL